MRETKVVLVKHQDWDLHSKCSLNGSAGVDTTLRGKSFFIQGYKAVKFFHTSYFSALSFEDLTSSLDYADGEHLINHLGPNKLSWTRGLEPILFRADPNRYHAGG